ncbi:MAG TPA: chemotaxis protein CheW [Opitutaceae bacterium]|nr:chemotaxis protein CheW [Opitutaceae bacterium]
MSTPGHYIVFELADFSYGVRSEDVLHLEALDHVTPVPNTAAAVAGVVFSRGEVLPALDLRRRFGLPPTPATPQTRLIFIQAHQRRVALIVDRAREFRSIPDSSIRPLAGNLHGIDGNYVLGHANIGDKVVLLLDLARVLTLEEVIPPLLSTEPPASL